MTIRELVTKWGFDVDDKPLKDLDESIGGLKNTLAVVGGAVAAAAATMFGFAKLSADAADAAQDMSIKVGVSTDNLQKLQYAAQLSGSSAEGMTQSLLFLSKNVGAALSGNKAMAENFANLGVAIRGANGEALSSDTIFRAMADRFKKMPEGPMKTAAAMEVLGKSGAEMNQLLNLGAQGIADLEARGVALGAVMSEDMIAAGTEFNDSLDEMMIGLGGLRNLIGYELMPVITPLIKQFTNWLLVNRKIIAANLDSVFKGLQKFVGLTVDFMRRLVDVTMAVTSVFGGATNVAKMLGYALAALSVGSILHGIGSVAIALKGVAVAIAGINVAALWLPLLIGAAVVAIGLIIEDIISFFRGEDSVTGIIVDSFGMAWEWVKNKSAEFFTWFSSQVEALALWLGQKIKAMLAPFEWILSKVSGGAMKLFGPDVTELVAKVKAGNMSGAMGISPTSSPVSNNSATSTMNNQISTPINITVGADANVRDIQTSVKGGINEALGPLLRGAARTYEGAGGY